MQKLGQTCFYKICSYNEEYKYVSKPQPRAVLYLFITSNYLVEFHSAIDFKLFQF